MLPGLNYQRNVEREVIACAAACGFSKLGCKHDTLGRFEQLLQISPIQARAWYSICWQQRREGRVHRGTCPVYLEPTYIRFKGSPFSPASWLLFCWSCSRRLYRASSLSALSSSRRAVSQLFSVLGSFLILLTRARDLQDTMSYVQGTEYHEHRFCVYTLGADTSCCSTAVACSTCILC